MRQIEDQFQLEPHVLKRKGGEVDILIGVNYPKLHVGKMKEKDGMVVQNSPLGWTVFGGNRNDSSNKHQVMNVIIHTPVDLTKFWTLESLGVDIGQCDCKKAQLANEEIEGKLIEDSCTKVDNKWTVPYPWIRNPYELKDNKAQAERMLRSLERRLLKSPDHAAAYERQMEEMVTMGYEGEAINDYWVKGPDLLNNLLGVLLRFRENEVALCADISKMYHRVAIPERDQHVHRYLWRNLEINRAPDVYIKLRLTFGDKPAPTMAQTALRLTARENEIEYPEAATILKRDTYMDDICPSVRTKEEASKIIHDVEKVLSSGGFSVKGWTSNKQVQGIDIKQDKVVMIDSEQRVL
ncbi:uncharacterized protein LOC117107695, partial [Anneissia japonica]|uniref:uncharacterized protein LOC117107695 n=1 Tax=Anneissia japonica TaxID=1529436 RepID=UPI001425516D